MSMANKYSSGTGPDENIQTGIVFKIVSVLKFPFRVANSICDFVILNSSRVIRENETIDKILFRSYRLGPFDTLNWEMLHVLVPVTDGLVLTPRRIIQIVTGITGTLCS